MLNQSSENLTARLQTAPVYITVNNACNDFMTRVPDGSVVHWSARIGPLLIKSLEIFEKNEELQGLTFAELKEKKPDVYSDVMEALNFIVRSGGRV